MWMLQERPPRCGKTAGGSAQSQWTCMLLMLYFRRPQSCFDCTNPPITAVAQHLACPAPGHKADFPHCLLAHLLARFP